MVGLLMFGVGCSGGSDDRTTVLGAVVERSGLGAAVPAGIEGIPVPEGVTPAVAELSGGRVFDLPNQVSLDDALVWFSGMLPEGRAFKSWAWCGKRQDSIGATWRWYRTDEPGLDTLTVEVGRDHRTGEGYVLTVIRPDHNPQSCDAG